MLSKEENTKEFTETGCYFDNHRGHYIARDVIEFAIAHGFGLDDEGKSIVDRYEDEYYKESYPFEAFSDITDEAIAWLNSDESPGRPDGYTWDWNDGDFGLYPWQSGNN